MAQLYYVGNVTRKRNSIIITFVINNRLFCAFEQLVFIYLNYVLTLFI